MKLTGAAVLVSRGATVLQAAPAAYPYRSASEAVMAPFSDLLAEIQRDCAWEHIPYDKMSALAHLCGSTEVDRVIRELDALDNADLVDDAGDVGDEYWRLRTAYSQVLAEVGEIAIDPLLRALGSENPETRGYAARALGKIGNSRAFSPIVDLLAADTVGGTRLLLIEALGELRDDRAVSILLPYLKAREQLNRGWIIRIAANALGKIGSDSVIEPLAEVLDSDSDWFARLGAAEGLRMVRHPSAAAALLRALKDADSRVQKEASAGLQ
jgi:HEAT repeat protein